MAAQSSSEAQTRLAAAIRRSIEALMGRTASDADLVGAQRLADELASQLERGEATPLAERVDRFVQQMTDRTGISEGTSFEAFVQSPYSGSENPLSPLRIDIVRSGDGVRAHVELGVAMEGAPGRSHGGTVAAIFDDVMGALQLVIGKGGYTRSLTVEYVAPFPIGAPVLVEAHEVEAGDGLFAIDAEARAGGRVVARAEGVFTEVPARLFARPRPADQGLS